MAAAMGARVYPGDRGPDIGSFPIHPSADGPIAEIVQVICCF